LNVDTSVLNGAAWWHDEDTHWLSIHFQRKYFVRTLATLAPELENVIFRSKVGYWEISIDEQLNDAAQEDGESMEDALHRVRDVAYDIYREDAAGHDYDRDFWGVRDTLVRVAVNTGIVALEVGDRPVLRPEGPVDEDDFSVQYDYTVRLILDHEEELRDDLLLAMKTGGWGHPAMQEVIKRYIEEDKQRDFEFDDDDVVMLDGPGDGNGDAENEDSSAEDESLAQMDWEHPGWDDLEDVPEVDDYFDRIEKADLEIEEAEMATLVATNQEDIRREQLSLVQEATMFRFTYYLDDEEIKRETVYRMVRDGVGLN
jgi:hypothetical protein